MSRTTKDNNMILIDLTESSMLATNRLLPNVVINLDTDDSIIEINSSIEESCRAVSKTRKLRRKSSIINKDKPPSSQTLVIPDTSGKKQCGFGECPICWDDLGKNRLASTKCGHVFCYKCLETSLTLEKKCPTCRTILKGNSAYHPLFLNMVEKKL